MTNNEMKRLIEFLQQIKSEELTKAIIDLTQILKNCKVNVINVYMKKQNPIGGICNLPFEDFKKIVKRPDFKLKDIGEILSGKNWRTSIHRNLGVTSRTIHRWRLEYDVTGWPNGLKDALIYAYEAEQKILNDNAEAHITIKNGEDDATSVC